MPERICMEWSGVAGVRGPVLRYQLLDRLQRTAAGNHIKVLAFGVATHALRLVLEGSTGAISSTINGVKSGTSRVARRIDVDVEWGRQIRQAVSPGKLDEAVAWAHQAPGHSGSPRPLASPWSSHRDLMGYRSATFYDARILAGRVDKRTVHRLANGGPLPRRPVPRRDRPEQLDTLLRIAGGCIGVLPADRRCFRLFAHLAKARGYPTKTVAEGLALSTRRIRQLAAQPEPQLKNALRCLADPRLRIVP
jgi:hypothetical protein